MAGSAGTGQAPAGVTFGSATGRWVLLASILGSGLAGIDMTVVNIALPAIGRDFDTGFSSLQWTVNAYTLTLASFILLGGSLGDRYGRRRVFLVGVVWFAVTSLACGLSPNAEVLIASRALQGVGAALMTPASLAMIQSSFVPGDRARAVGAWSGLGGVATAIGPFLGGWLVETASWRWVFLINVPLAALVVVLALRHVPETRDTSAGGPVDVLGAALGALGLAGVTYALVEAPSRGVGAVPVLVAGVLGVAACVAFVLVERRAASPMLPLRIFASRQFRAVNGLTFGLYAAFSVVLFLLTLQLQVVAGFSPLAAGTATLPITVVMLLLSARAGALAQRIGPRPQLVLGPVVCAAGTLLMLRIGPDASYVLDVLPGILVLGLGFAMLVAPLTSTALASADARHAGVASGVNNAVARAAGLLAVALVPAVAGLTGDVDDDPTAFLGGFRTAVLISGGILLVSAALAALTVSNDRLSGDDPDDPDDPATPAPPVQEPLRHCGIGAPPLVVTRDAAPSG